MNRITITIVWTGGDFNRESQQVETDGRTQGRIAILEDGQQFAVVNDLEEARHILAAIARHRAKAGIITPMTGFTIKGA
jgi:hypothetical protein